jgi:hypothetical protein
MRTGVIEVFGAAVFPLAVRASAAALVVPLGHRIVLRRCLASAFPPHWKEEFMRDGTRVVLSAAMCVLNWKCGEGWRHDATAYGVHRVSIVVAIAHLLPAVVLVEATRIEATNAADALLMLADAR